jgi:hypothetical protein
VSLVPGARRCTALIATCAVAITVGWTNDARAAGDYTWTGADSTVTSGPFTVADWSAGANWTGGSPPSGSIGTVTFPLVLGDDDCLNCATSDNDISGLTVGAIDLEGFDSTIEGDGITLGSGGLTVQGDTDDEVSVTLPITLGAPQTWSLGGSDSSPTVQGATVTGNEPLALDLANDAWLFPQSIDVGTITASGSGELWLMGSDDLNSSSGHTLSLANGAQLLAQSTGNATGPVVVDSGGSLMLGAGSDITDAVSPGTLDVHGGVTFTANSTLGLTINAAGTSAGTDFSQLSVSGSINLTGAGLDLEQDADADGNCEDLSPGDVLTLVSATGGIHGTFSGVSDDQTVEIADACNGADTPATAVIDYSANTVTATIVSGGDVADVAQNTSPPTLPSTVQAGQLVTVTNGSWTGNPSFSYQWSACNLSGCASIPGAIGPSFTPTAQQVGDVLEVEVTATDAAGSNSITSGDSGVVTAEPVPVLATAPTVGGGTTQGDALTVTTGGWTNSPTGYGYQWEDCDAGGQNCTPIAGATAGTYTLTGTDAGHTVVVAVTATNYGGPSATASSAPTAVVLPLPPANTAAPQISGTAAIGQTLTVANGSWNNNPTSFSDQWQSCGASGDSCQPVAGATGTTFEIAAAQAGERLEVVVTAHNAGGDTPAASASTGVVPAVASTGRSRVPPPSRRAIEAALAKILRPHGKNATAAALLAHHGYVFHLTAPGAGKLTLSWSTTVKHKTVIVARASVTLAVAGAKRFTESLTSPGKRLLRGKDALKLISHAAFTAVGGQVVTASAHFAISASSGKTKKATKTKKPTTREQ